MEIIDAPKRKNLISLTPLIDVVFILLIFFMLSSSFIEWKYIELGVSDAESLPIDSNKQSVIVIHLDETYSLNNITMGLKQLTFKLEEKIRLEPDHLVLIKPKKNLLLQELVTVLDAVGVVAGSNISLIKDEE